MSQWGDRPIVNQCDAEENLTRRGPNSGHKKRPRQEPNYRAWVLSPDRYTILPMRPVTTTRTIAIFMMLLLDRNLHVVNAHPLAKRDPQLITRARRRPLVADEPTRTFTVSFYRVEKIAVIENVARQRHRSPQETTWIPADCSALRIRHYYLKAVA
jgi:hypothetical protein